MVYKFLEHTADLKIQVKEKTLEEAFSTAALAMKEAMIGKLKVKPFMNREIKVTGKDYERLLYEFLEQFLYLLDADDFIMCNIISLSIEEELDSFRLDCILSGDKASDYKFTNNVKAITYNEMIISESPRGGVVIQFVVDV